MTAKRRRDDTPARWEAPLLKPWGLPLVLALIILPLYVTFRSVSLDDFDSYSFALALETFNLELQQPQPPGFPVYIALGRALYALTRRPAEALTILSALSGAVAILLVYALSLALRPHRHTRAIFAALIFGLIPVSWLTAGKALSDVPGMMWTLLALWLWARWRGAIDRAGHGAARHPTPWVAAAATGVALGVRPQNALPIILLTGSFFVSDLARRRNLTPWVYAVGAGIAGILLWLVPTARAAGGFRAYVRHILDHAAHVGRADALAGMGQPLVEALRIRAVTLLDTALVAMVGGGLYPPQPVNVLARALIVGSVGLAGLLMADYRRRTTRQLAVWALSVTLQLFFFETLDRPRLLLPVLPPLALLIASGWSNLRRPTGPIRKFTTRNSGIVRILRVDVMATTAWLLMLWSAPLAAQLSQVPAPPVQATHFVREHYPPEGTLVAAAGSFRAAQVELPTYPLVYLYEFNAITAAAARDDAQFVVIFDRDQITQEAIEILSDGGRWVGVEDRTFFRDRRVHTQHDQVRLQVLTPPDRVPPEAMTLPPGGCIDIGGGEDGRYLGQGWFRPEQIAGSSARWAGETVTTTLRFNPGTKEALRLQLRALAYPAEQTVTLYRDGTRIGTAALAQDWTEVEMTIPEPREAASPVVVLTLVHAMAQSPQEATGTSSDTRALTAAYDRVCVLAATTMSISPPRGKTLTANAGLVGQSKP
jgi:hypothetical protein